MTCFFLFSGGLFVFSYVSKVVLDFVGVSFFEFPPPVPDITPVHIYIYIYIVFYNVFGFHLFSWFSIFVIRSVDSNPDSTIFRKDWSAELSS